MYEMILLIHHLVYIAAESCVHKWMAKHEENDTRWYSYERRENRNTKILLHQLLTRVAKKGLNSVHVARSFNITALFIYSILESLKNIEALLWSSDYFIQFQKHKLQNFTNISICDDSLTSHMKWKTYLIHS